MAQRGTYDFDLQADGRIADNSGNKEKLRRLFRDSAIIDDHWGPGDSGDFEWGSWHILCHLAGGSGVYRTPSGARWVGITHDATNDHYVATVTAASPGGARTVALASAEGEGLLAGATLAGWVEGTSLGHILARNVRDPAGTYNGWLRQDFDQPASNTTAAGGTVWEHWCTTRDLRPTNIPGDSVLGAWLSLVALFGGEYVAVVARGRREHEHPRQLSALVKAGLLTREEATIDFTPNEIPTLAEALLQEARPADCLRAAESLTWPAGRRAYWMFGRKIREWSRKATVVEDLSRWVP